MGRGQTRTGGTMGRKHNGTETDGDGDTMGLGYNGTGAQWTDPLFFVEDEL